MDSLNQIFTYHLSRLLTKILASPYTVIRRQSQKVILDGDSGIQTEYINIPDYRSSFNAQAEDIINRYDFGDLNKLVDSEYPLLNGSIGNSSGSRGYSGDRYVRKLVYSILKEPPTLDNLADRIEKEMELFLQILSDKTYTMILYRPIRNLVLPQSETKIEFASNIALEVLGEEVLTDLFLNHYTTPDLAELCRTALVVSYNDDIIFGADKSRRKNNPEHAIDSQVDCIVKALNLVSSGALGNNSRIYRVQGLASNFIGSSSRKSFSVIRGSQVRISTEQIQEWKSYYKILDSLGTEAFELALHKLNEAETRLSPKDSILDAVVGLESLLLNDIGNEKTRGELNYRFCINYASLFPVEIRFEKYKEARETYGIRSILVHGGKMNSDIVKYDGRNIYIVDLKEMVINQLREVLKLLLDNYNSDPFDTENYWINKVLDNGETIEITREYLDAPDDARVQ